MSTGLSLHKYNSIRQAIFNYQSIMYGIDFIYKALA
jgi:hypothetical protein